MCSQLSPGPSNNFSPIVKTGTDTSSRTTNNKRDHLLRSLFNLKNLFIKFKYYFQPALSNIITASLLFCPNSFKGNLSSLKSPHFLSVLAGSTFGLTGYS